MPRVTAIEVGYRRTRQPAQYETAEAEVKVHIAVDEQEAAVDVAAFSSLHLDAIKGVVLSRLGLQAIAPIAAAAPVVAVAEVPTLPAVALATASPAAPQSAGEPQKRTRRTKAQIEADNALAAAPATTPPPETDPSDMTTVVGSPAAQAAVTATPTSAGDKTVTDADLQKAAMTAASRLGQSGPNKVKAVIKEYGVARLSEIVDQGKRREIIAKLGALT